jgi:hypothetical protein
MTEWGWIAGADINRHPARKPNSHVTERLIDGRKRWGAGTNRPKGGMNLRPKGESGRTRHMAAFEAAGRTRAIFVKPQ